MAVATQGVVLARVNTPVVTHNELEAVEIPAPEGSDEDTQVVERWIKVYAQPGDVIDVASWHGLGAYVERGQVTLLTPAEANEHLAANPPKAPARGGKSDKES